jgi:hypothetical protein
MKVIVLDCEADGLYPTKFYVVSYEEDGVIHSLTDPEEMKAFLLRENVIFAGHNLLGWDIPQLERVLKIKITAKIIDTLYLSWYLYPERKLHGLEWWGRELGVAKPEIKSWYDEELVAYVHRCEEDVKINLLLWERQKAYLRSLYLSDTPESLPIVSYLMFKAECAREQERSRWRLDKAYCQEALALLEAEQQPKIDALKKVMPTVQKRQLKQPPTKPFKKDGTLSVEGAKWQKYLREQGLTKDHNSPIYIVVKEEEPNPGSPPQIKDWLFSLGWEPITFKFVKEDDGTERKIPQVKLPNNPDICPSVLELAEKESAIHELAGLSVLQHRIGILKGFLDNVDEGGFLRARVQGLTNTLRFKHTEIVNLPGVDKPYGKYVRGCLIARDGYELCGSDMNSLEDNTKKHYMYEYDPDYVIEMSQKGFDPHLDLAKRSGAVSEDDVSLYIAHKDDQDLGSNMLTIIKQVAGIRKIYKVVNYSAVYGVGAAKLARELKCTVAFAKGLLEGYWSRNWAVQKIAEDCVVKIVNGQKWLFNPVSKFWYSLRADKDRFSTLNQGTGVFCFDTWVREIRRVRSQLTAQFHDEVVLEIKDGSRDKATLLLKDAISRVNDKLRLNIQLGVDVQFGHRYSDIH